MKIYKLQDGRCNHSGVRIKELREKMGLSQEALAARIQLEGALLNQKAISRIENVLRIVPDYELLFFSRVFSVPLEELLQPGPKSKRIVP